MKRAIAVLAALTLPLVACGDDDSSSGAPDGTSTDAGTGADTPAGDEGESGPGSTEQER